jgi:membrane protease YdiL (CAAX protease family)
MNVFILDDGRLRSGWRFALGAILAVAANFVAGTLSDIVARGHLRLEDAIYRLLTMVLELAAFLVLTKVFDQPECNVWTYNGLSRRHWLRQSLLGALLGFAMVTVAIVVIASFFHLTVNIWINNQTLGLGVIVLSVILAAAMAEELAFRGYPFQRLVEGLGPLGAVVVLSTLFGAVHMSNPHVSDNRWVQVFAFSNTLLIGIVLALAYLRTRALWASWGLHVGWNATLGLIYGLPVSGINQFSVFVRSTASGPEWLLGGKYGLEGGALGTMVILLGMACVLLFPKPLSSGH